MPPVIDGGRPQSLEPAICKVWQWSSVISWGILGIVMGLTGLLFSWRHPERMWWAIPSGPLLAIIFASFSWWIADRQYKAWSYQLKEKELILSHGLVWKSRRVVARGRVQHIDINSGPLDRRFGLVQVAIYVAGALGSVGAIPGLSPQRAEELRAAILEGRDLHA